MRGVLLDQPIAREVVRDCLSQRLIVNATDESTLRLVPPLIINADHVDEALAILARVMAKVRS